LKFAVGIPIRVGIGQAGSKAKAHAKAQRRKVTAKVSCFTPACNRPQFVRFTLKVDFIFSAFMNPQDNYGKMIEKLCNYFATIILQKKQTDQKTLVEIFRLSF
jgi:hypothetical protein